VVTLARGGGEVPSAGGGGNLLLRKQLAIRDQERARRRGDRMGPREWRGVCCPGCWTGARAVQGRHA
jgi:hypothetical protein